MYKHNGGESLPRWWRERKSPPDPLAFQKLVARIPPMTCCRLHQAAHRHMLASVRSPGSQCRRCGALGVWRAGWPPLETPYPVPTPCGTHVNEAELAVYYDLCVPCRQVPGALAQIAALLRQRRQAPSRAPTPAEILARLPPCLLCQAPSVLACLFVPEGQHAWGVPSGWRGHYLYALCTTCLWLSDRNDRVEAKLWQERTRRAAAPWN